MENKNIACWICGSSSLILAKKSDITKPVSSENFAITDSDYGRTGELKKCTSCGFIQCSDLNNVVSFYENLKDEDYEQGREQRSLQANKLLDLIAGYKNSGRLLDIGAGSGILVEQAIARGYDSEGVDPSRWLQEQAVNRGLKIHLGVFPHTDILGNFDVITLVDVIEHVSNPVELLKEISLKLSDTGLGLVVTPDAGSVVAKLLGWKWWHYRIAHIGYFNKEILLAALDKVGLESIKIGRPSWYFSADYLVERVNKYLPRYIQLPVFQFLKRVTIPLNLRDSYYVAFRKKGGKKF